jgi:carbamoyltransferase
MKNKSIITLGINDGHDSGAALIKDGKVLAALQEERVRNIKHYAGVPELSIREVFRTAHINPDDVDVVSIASFNRVYSPLAKEPLKIKVFEKISPYANSHTFAKTYVKVLHRFRRMQELNKVLESLGLANKKTVFVEHHLCHASAAYRSSPWGYDKPQLILTADGVGDGVSSTVNIGNNGEIKRIAWSTYYDSLGEFYSEITRYLGMKPMDHEYKVMGLAPYGKAEYCIEKLRNIMRISPSNPLEFQNTSGAYHNSLQPKLQSLLAGQRFDNVAAAIQTIFEDLMLKWVKNAVKETKIHNLACGGGSFLNVKANKRIREMPEVEEVFYYPPAGDDGIAIGAALQAYYDYCKTDGIKPIHASLSDLYYGVEFTNEEIKQALRKDNLLRKAQFYKDIDGRVGELLAKGKIVARFSGRVEFGPRSLGNRSILSDARDFKVVRKINQAIKQRDFWMPFAPTILEDRMKDYLIDVVPARYMIDSFDTTKMRDDIAAAIHPQDFTCRPQTLNKMNPGYKKILETFQDITGVGGVLNTSFNLHGYPIVGTPELAIWTFKNSSLDALAIGNFLVSKK